MQEVTTIDQKQKQDLFSLSPRSLEEAIKYAEIISKTDMVPKDFKGNPGNVLVAVQMGAEVGLPPTQALQNIAVINGRPAIWGDAALAIIKARSDFEYIKESENDQLVAECRLKRRGEEEVVRTFSHEDAKVAGLAGKQGPWTQYPKRMRQMRARSFAIRDCYPDALKGISIAEEAQDLPQEREVTGQTISEKPATRTEGLKDKLKATKEKKAETETSAQEATDLWPTISAAIDNAKDENALSEAIKDVDQLPDDLKKKARICYRYRLGQLRGEPVQIEDGHVVNGETGAIII